MLQRVYVALDQQQIRARFHGEEPAARNVHSVSTLEVLDGCSCRRFELDDCLTIVQGFLVDNNFQVHALAFHHPLECGQVDPDVVSVEDLEFADGLEIFQMFRRYLGDFEQAN